MRIKILVSLMFAVAASSSSALDAISLQKMLINKDTMTVVGNCGETTVYLKAFDKIIDSDRGSDGYMTTQSKTVLVLKVGDRIETLSVANSALSDFLGVNCLSNAKGRSFLVLRTNCGGSVCGEEFHHVVFDPKSLRILNPVEGRKQQRCGDKCFSQVLKRLAN